MHAAFTDSYGPADVLDIREAPTPTLGEHDVLVEVRASPVTAGDRRLRSADFPSISKLPGLLMIGMRRPRHPIQGSMFAGLIAAVGAKVTRYAVGDQVFGHAEHGAYAEYVAMPEDGAMARIPAGLEFHEAAALPYGFGTALHFLTEVAKLERGQSVLILGASGGVGRYAIQLAKHLGAEVTAVASRETFALVRELGAEHVIDYHTQDFRESGRRYDLIFDVAGVSSFRHSRGALRPEGRYMALFLSVGVLLQMALNGLRRQQASFDLALPDHAAFERMRELAEAGVVRPVIAERFTLREIIAAHAAAERRPHGDVIVEVAPAHDDVMPRIRAA